MTDPTDPQAELREQVEDMAMKYNIPLADLESLIDELLTTERERVIGEARWEGISNKALLDEKWKKYQGNLTYYDFCLQELEALKKAPDAK